MKPHEVFLSFASEDAGWKQNFTRRDWFKDNLGLVIVTDYKMGEGLPFGPLQDWLTTKVDGSAVFIAFISEHYISKKHPLKEWWSALDTAQRRRVIIVLSYLTP